MHTKTWQEGILHLQSQLQIKPANTVSNSHAERNPKPSSSTHTMAAVLENFINGEFVSCSSHLDSYNPATGEVHLEIPDSGKEEVDAAVHAAKTAFKK